MRNKRVRCNIVGCLGWAFKGDCRCLKHIQQKYAGVWAYNITGFSSETGYRKMPIHLDKYEQ